MNATTTPAETMPNLTVTEIIQALLIAEESASPSAQKYISRAIDALNRARSEKRIDF